MNIGVCLRLSAVAAIMLIQAAFSETVTKSVTVHPNDRKRVPIRITDGPITAKVIITPAERCHIVESHISAQDDILWKGPTKVGDAHHYDASLLYSGIEYLLVNGKISKEGAFGGGGKSRLPDFRVTVPKVNIDWANFTVESTLPNGSRYFHERIEHENRVCCPITATTGLREKVLILEPKDDFECLTRPLVLTVSIDRADVVSLWDAPVGGVQFTPITVVSGSSQMWPQEYYVDISAPVSAFTITLNGSGSEDKILGRTGIDIQLFDDNTGEEIREAMVAYVTAAPTMPKLRAKLIGIPDDDDPSETALWKMECAYTRPNRGSFTGDKHHFPIDFRNGEWQPKTLTGHQEWKIHEDMARTNFFGGEAFFTCVYKDTTYKRNFGIRGKNLAAPTVKGHLDASGYWFAYAIAKHESSYKQFNSSGVLGTGDEDFLSCPNRGQDENSQGVVISYGWGIMQLTHQIERGIGTGGQLRMPDGGLPWGTELWSWKDNCDTGVFVIRQKEYYALTYLDQEFDGDWPPQVTLNGHVFSTQNGHDPSDLETIKRYNSGTFWRSYSPLKKVWVSALGEVKDDGTSAFEGSGKNADYTLRVTHEMEVEQ